MRPRLSHGTLAWLVLTGGGFAQEALFSVSGLPGSLGFAAALARGGDVDGNGREDLLVGTLRLSPSIGGVVSALDGATGLELFAIDVGYAGSPAEIHVASAGDVDQDGTPDILVSLPSLPVEQQPGTWLNHAGVVQLYSGATQTLLRTHAGNVANAALGAAITSVGDIDLDGVPDYAIGSPRLLTAGPGTADRIAVHSGASGALLWEVAESGPMNRFGASLAAAGDTNLDGIVDLAVGAPGIPGNSLGSVRMLSGSDGATLWTATGETALLYLGTSIATGGDLDHDGIGDVLAGTFRDFFGGSLFAGSARVYSGATGAKLRLFSAVVPNVNEGSAVSFAGDVDQDGTVDVAIGASLDDSFALTAGAVRVYSGATADPLYSVFGKANGERLGGGVVGGVDFDLDGQPDLAVAGSGGSAFGGSASGQVQVVTDCLGHVAWHGSGCAGTFASGSLNLVAAGCATAGQTLTLRIGPSATVNSLLLLAAPGTGTTPIGGGCSYLLGQNAFLLLSGLFIPVEQAPPTSAHVAIAALVPAGFLGQVSLQAFSVSPFGGSPSASNALTIEVQ